MEEQLWLKINDLCKNSNVHMMWRQDHVNNIFYFVFTKGDKVIHHAINEHILAYQPEWITMRAIKERIDTLLEVTNPR